MLEVNNSTLQYEVTEGRMRAGDETDIKELLIFCGVVAFLFSLLAVFGNLLTIVSLIKFENLQTMTNTLICCLAGCDAASGLVLFPLDAWLTIYSQSPELPDSWLECCRFSEFLRQLFIMGNNYIILLIGLDRLLCLDYPLRYPVIISYYEKWLLGSALLLFLIVIVPIGASTFISSMDVPPQVCSMVYVFMQSNNRLLRLSLFTCLLLATFIIYVRITYIAIKSNTKHQAQRCTHHSPAPTLRVYIKVLRMIVTIFWTHVIVYMPLLVLLALTVQAHGFYTEYLDYSFRLIWRISIWINPVVYAWSCKDFRKAFRTILRIRKHASSTPATIIHIRNNQI